MTDIRNVVLFGQAGVGKSSIINMLAGKPLAKVPSQTSSVAPSNHTYSITHRDECTYRFWDTPGLDDKHGAISSQHTVQNLRNLLKGQRVDLFIYCIRFRLMDIIHFDYELVWKNPSREKVPSLLVVTGMEFKGLDEMDEWWCENEKTIKMTGMTFDGHACITSSKGRDNMYGEKYKESAEKIWSLVTEHCGPRHNVIVFGESGSGKSSIVNMIVGKGVAKVSGGLKGCTFQNDAYEAIIGDKRFVVYDTAGLNEGKEGHVPHWQAIQELYTLIRQLDGVGLLIYCMRGRVRENAKANWDLFNKVICGGKVPIIAIVTGLEDYEDPDEFWMEKKNRDVFKKNGMEPKGVGCVVSSRGKHDRDADIYAKSQVKVQSLVTTHCLQKSWSEEKEKWFAAIYSEAYNSGLCFASRSRLEYSEHMRNIFDEFVREAGMKEDDTEKLRVTMVKAEKKFRKGRLRVF